MTIKRIVYPEVKCQQCDYKWPPRVPDPKECPSCKRRDWNDPA